ncbi:hypothetical protein BS47DRAFT_1273119, partial [Hydnum rufescens UP504]
LPASFTRSPKYYSEKVADALALAQQKGKPNLMITATCNPNWPEIKVHLRHGQSAIEVSHVTNHVFKKLLHIQYCVYVIEFQKHGLPHAHIIV